MSRLLDVTTAAKTRQTYDPDTKNTSLGAARKPRLRLRTHRTCSRTLILILDESLRPSRRPSRDSLANRDDSNQVSSQSAVFVEMS